jgi:LysM repeat protein
MILPAGTVVKNKKTNVVGIIEGGSRMVTLGETSMQLTLPAPRVLTPLQLVGYHDTEVLGSFKVRCDGDVFLVSDSQLHAIPVATAREYPGRATVLSPETCLLISPSPKQFSQYIGLRTTDAKTKKTSYKTFKVIRGVRYPFKNLTDYKTDNSTGLQLNWVSESFLNNLPLGAEIQSPGKPVVVEPEAKTYKIVSGDSLSSISVKFNTTVAILMRLNGINNADRIAVGQIIKLP